MAGNVFLSCRVEVGIESILNVSGTLPLHPVRFKLDGFSYRQ